MKYEKGKRKTGGRSRGSQNKFTNSVKAVILEVFGELQADPKSNLLAWAKRNPRDFYFIAAKLIPTEITTQGQSMAPVQIIVDSPAGERCD